MMEEARAIRSVLEPAGVPLLINDRVDVALAAEADGVHIGQDDMAAADARLLLGRTAIIGLSINTVQQAKAAPLELLDYVGDWRRLRAPTSKDDASRRSELLACATSCRRCVRASAGFPICGISGIDPGNAAEVIAAGADGVAVISALSLAPDPGQAARELRAVVDEALKRRGKS